MSVNRCYSEKKNGFDVEARSLFSSLHDLLEIKNLTHVRYLREGKGHRILRAYG